MFLRFRVIALKPFRCLLVRLQRPRLVPDFYLVNFGQVLLMSRCPSEIPLGDIMLDRYRENTSGIFWIGLAIYFKGLGHRVRGVIGLAEILGLYRGSLFERLARFLVCIHER